MKFDVVLEKGDDGWITVTVPTLPGCISQGKSEKEALVNIREAIELHLEEINTEIKTHKNNVRTVDVAIPS